MLKLPQIFSNRMVIGKKAKLWGKSNPNGDVAITFIGISYNVETDNEGYFEIYISTEDYGGPYELNISNSTNEVIISDVYVGYVWLFAGHFNIEFSSKEVQPLLEKYIKNESRIRTFHVQQDYNTNVLPNDVICTWHATQNNYDIPYFFAQDLIQELDKNVIVGLINVTHNDTKVESWLNEHGIIYDNILSPILGYSVSGIAWHQCEASVYRANEYIQLFKKFTILLRNNFGKDIPIIFTQLPNFNSLNSKINLPELREQQRQCLNISNTAMVVTIDCENGNYIHPKYKELVGKRIAICAKKLSLGFNIEISGPTVANVVILDGEFVVFFDNAYGMWTKNGKPKIEVIDIYGNVQHIYAEIVKESLRAPIDDRTQVAKVKFGYEDCPSITIYNAQDLPATPFVFTNIAVAWDNYM